MPPRELAERALRAMFETRQQYLERKELPRKLERRVESFHQRIEFYPQAAPAPNECCSICLEDLSQESVVSSSRTLSTLAWSRNVGSRTLCAICKEDLEDADTTLDEAKKVRIKLCSHVFHEVCLREWADFGHTCPICRRTLFQPTSSDNSSSGEQIYDFIPLLHFLQLGRARGLWSRPMFQVIISDIIEEIDERYRRSYGENGVLSTLQATTRMFMTSFALWTALRDADRD
ncbi:hypothetical protein BDV96DRAFT_598861 [Lophiotrema nucula]|uniref:RING-type domain-containing protein n=1 Tax=Lophiotrema nucula TaxID=690887 RepID=A0A6A5ZBJ7_9PLEO|nr:hypothetical protein BDV96DRAFT_598861 [Lophiotrema nucula]